MKRHTITPYQRKLQASVRAWAKKSKRKEALKALGYSPAEIARKLKIAPGDYNKY